MQVGTAEFFHVHCPGCVVMVFQLISFLVAGVCAIVFVCQLKPLSTAVHYVSDQDWAELWILDV